MRALAFAVVLGLGLSLPLLWREDPGPPLVYSGDEPHYLVILNSLLNDGDLDVSNNYRAVHQGADQAGRRFRGYALDHHVTFYRDGRHYLWSDLYETWANHWQRDAETGWRPKPLPGVPPELIASLEGGAEYSQHPYGLPLALVPWTFWARGTPWVEPIALLFSVLVVFGTGLLLRQFLARFIPPLWASVWAAIVVFGSPLWNASRTLFSEPWLAGLGLASYVLLASGRPALAGVAMGLAFLMKPPVLLLLLPALALVALKREKRWEVARGFGLGMLPALALFMATNAWLFGHPLRSSLPFMWGSLAEGLPGLLWSPEKGIVWFAPWLLSASLGWIWIVRSPGLRARLAPAALGAGLYFGLMAQWKFFGGGYCYGPRLILPVLPFAALGVIGLHQSRAARPWIALTLALGVFGIVANFWPAVQPNQHWQSNPGFSLILSLWYP